MPQIRHTHQQPPARKHFLPWLSARLAGFLGLFVLTVASRAAAPTYLLSEGFEGTGYENSGWYVPPNSTSAPDPDHAESALLGEQSLRCNGVSFIQRSFVRQDPFFCYLRVRWASWSDYKFVVDWVDATQSSTATLLTSFGRKLEIRHGSISVPGTTTIALNTTYHVWIEWTRGNGNNGTMKLFVSTNPTKPSAPEVSIANGTGVSPALFDVGPFGAGVDVLYDSILIDDEEIGSNPGGNAPPTISAIANQATAESTPAGPIPFTVGDLETNAIDLVVTGTSSNTSLVQNASIEFGGSGSNRTVTIIPEPNQSGVSVITLTVSDGTATASTSFPLTVGTTNTPPTISAIANQATPENTPTAPIPFTIGDAQSAVESLAVEGTSSNTGLVPAANIVFGGSGANRNVTLTPAPGQTGNSTISISVNDGQSTNTTSFVLTVAAPNTPPSLSPISSQTLNENTTLGPVGFVIADAQTPASALTVTASSSNPGVIPNSGITLGGNNENRTFTLAPATNSAGLATITISVNDGELTTSRSFLVTVIPNGTGSTNGLLFEEGFEGSGYQNPGWSEVGFPNPDYTDNPLRDEQSMNLTGGDFIYRRFVAPDHFNIYLRATWITWRNYISFINFETANYDIAGSLFADNGVFQINHGAASRSGTTRIIPDVVYHIWLDWSHGNGTDGAMSLYVSTNVIKPSLPEASVSTGTGGAIERIYFGASSPGFDVIIDSIFIDDDTIGSNPEGNQPPTVSPFADLTIDEDTSTGAIDFTIGDLESPAASLQVTGFSSNTNLVPNANIVFGGSESNRTVTVTPVPNQSGSTTITIAVRDHWLTTNQTFVLTVNPINDPPFLALPGDGASFTEGSGPVALNSLAVFTDEDSPSLEGGRLQIVIVENGTPDDRLAIRNQGVGAGEIGVSDDVITYDGANIGTFSGGTNADSPLLVSFNASASPFVAQSLLRAITFENVSTTPSTLARTISIVAEDGQGGSNAPVTMIVTVTAVRANPSIGWVAPAPIPYGTALSSNQLNAIADIPGTFTYTPESGTVLAAGENQLLVATFTPADTNNFNTISTNVLLTVVPAPLVITADDAIRPYGQTNPLFTASIAGFVNGDAEAVLAGELVLSTLADTNSPVGQYNITPAGLSATNYAITFVDGTLEVTPVALVATADNLSKVYGADLPMLTGALVGIQNGDDITATFTTTATATNDVGEYPITPVLTDPNNLQTNYSVTLLPGTLTNLPAPLLVTANNATRPYGQTNPLFTATITGLVNGDDNSVLLGTLAFATLADTNSPAGPYPVTPGGLSATNYAITFVDGTLEITPAATLTLVLLSADRLGNATLRVTSSPGQLVTLQASTNLTTWDHVTILTNVTGTADFTDAATPERAHRFYRAVLVPQFAE